MAYTGISAISRGIELVQSRHDVAISIKQHMERIYKPTQGEIERIHGRLEDEKHRDFLCKADLSIVNNAYGVFADRSATKEGEYTPDDYVAAVMIPFYPIHRQLGLSLEGAKARRKEHNMVNNNLSLSFYSHEEFDLNKCGEKVSTLLNHKECTNILVCIKVNSTPRRYFCVLINFAKRQRKMRLEWLQSVLTMEI
jgi:hypothetical protein